MQPTANLKKAIERRSCSYGKLPTAAGAVDRAVDNIIIAIINSSSTRTNHITINEDRR